MRFKDVSNSRVVARVLRGLACGTLAVVAVTGESCRRESAAAGGGGGRGRGGTPAQPVLMAKAVKKNVPVLVEAIGNVEASSTVTVKAQVSGQLTQLHFREGDFVKIGDELVTIDPRPYQALLQQAEANLTRDTALLSQAE